MRRSQTATSPRSQASPLAAMSSASSASLRARSCLPSNQYASARASRAGHDVLRLGDPVRGHGCLVEACPGPPSPRRARILPRLSCGSRFTGEATAPQQLLSERDCLLPLPGTLHGDWSRRRAGSREGRRSWSSQYAMPRGEVSFGLGESPLRAVDAVEIHERSSCLLLQATGDGDLQGPRNRSSLALPAGQPSVLSASLAPRNPQRFGDRPSLPGQADSLIVLIVHHPGRRDLAYAQASSVLGPSGCRIASAAPAAAIDSCPRHRRHIVRDSRRIVAPRAAGHPPAPQRKRVLTGVGGILPPVDE